MTQPYNYTLIENSTGVLPIMQQVNTWTDGFMGPLLLLTIALVMFAATRNQDTRTAFVVISFTNIISASLLFFLELVKMSVIGVSIAIFVGALLVYFIND